MCYDINAHLVGIENDLVKKATEEGANVQQVDEHGSCRIIFSRSTVTVTYKEGKICDIRDGHKEWSPSKTIAMIKQLDHVEGLQPLNALAAIAHTQRIGNIQNEINDQIAFIFEWIKQM